jgi:hypothetical protein
MKNSHPDHLAQNPQSLHIPVNPNCRLNRRRPGNLLQVKSDKQTKYGVPVGPPSKSTVYVCYKFNYNTPSRLLIQVQF